MNKQQVIVATLRHEYELAVAAYRKAHADHVGMIVSANAWDDHNPDDGVGGMSQNPYNTDISSDKDISARKNYEKLREAYNFAVGTFLSDSPPEDK